MPETIFVSPGIISHAAAGPNVRFTLILFNLCFSIGKPGFDVTSDVGKSCPDKKNWPMSASPRMWNFVVHDSDQENF